MPNHPTMALSSTTPVGGLLFDPTREAVVREKIAPKLGERIPQLWPYPGHATPDWGPGATVWVYLDDTALAELLPEAAKRQWRLGVLPHPELNQARLYFGVTEHLDMALTHLLDDPKEQFIDLFYCNGRVVFQSVVVGKVFTLGGIGATPGFLQRLQSVASVLRSSITHLELNPYTLTTAKEQSLETAALGLVMVEQGGRSLLSRPLLDDASSNDGLLHALILAPRSRLEFMRFLLVSLWAARGGEKLPPFVGHLKTAALAIISPKPLDYLHDGVGRSARQLKLTVAPNALRVLPGPHLRAQAQGPQSRETYKVQGLPTGNARAALLGRSLPWLHRATAEEFKELYSALRENARISQAYLTLMVLATILATLGLFADSAPVIIGAMILAPLMAPIISLAMAVVRQDNGLLAASLKTLGLGMCLALGCAVVITWLMPLRSMTGEIAARLSPTLLDLGVALISGVAGAYAHAREEVARSLAGVAIAVALVPPLAVSGIGLGWGDWLIFQNSFVLFLTNLFGIVLAGNLTFLALGFGPFGLARRGLLAALVLVAVISVPLGFGLARMMEEQSVVRALEGQKIADVVVRQVTVQLDDPLTDLLARTLALVQPKPEQGDGRQAPSTARPLALSARLLAPRPMDGADVERVKQAMEARIGRPVRLEATLALVR